VIAKSDSKTGQHKLTVLDKNGQHQPVQPLDKPIHTIPKRSKRASKGVRLSPHFNKVLMHVATPTIDSETLRHNAGHYSRV